MSGLRLCSNLGTGDMKNILDRLPLEGHLKIAVSIYKPPTMAETHVILHLSVRRGVAGSRMKGFVYPNAQGQPVGRHT